MDHLNLPFYRTKELESSKTHILHHFQVWRIENLELVPVDPGCLGYFYGGDCYLVLYTYLVNNRKSYVLYIWQVS